MNKARKGPAFLVIFLMLLLIVAYIYAEIGRAHV